MADGSLASAAPAASPPTAASASVPVIRLEIVTPRGVAVSRSVRLATVPAEEGCLGIMAGHEPTVFALAPGTVTLVTPAGEREAWEIGPGFGTVIPDQATLLVQHARPAPQADGVSP